MQSTHAAEASRQSRARNLRCLRALVAGLLATAASVAAGPASAAEGGGSVYPYGLNTVATGVLPKPGHYLYNYNLYYAADVTRTNTGAAAPVAFDLAVRAHTLRYLGVHPTAKAFGGSLGWLVAQPYVIGDVNVGPRGDSRGGFADTTVGAMLGWRRSALHATAGVDLTLPTGSYAATRLFNPGRNQWAGTFHGALTAPLGERFDANLRANLTWSGPNPATRYRSGLDAGLEYSLNVRLAPGWLAGVNGYLQGQLTDDEVGGLPVNGHGQRTRGFAIGPQLVYRGRGWGAVAKWQHESDARNRAEGDKVWLQLFYAL